MILKEKDQFFRSNRKPNSKQNRTISEPTNLFVYRVLFICIFVLYPIYYLIFNSVSFVYFDLVLIFIYFAFPLIIFLCSEFTLINTKCLLDNNLIFHFLSSYTRCTFIHVFHTFFQFTFSFSYIVLIDFLSISILFTILDITLFSFSRWL